ncbi:MAG: DUF2218 domain-containing protein [Methyloligellaceae bacterium]
MKFISRSSLQSPRASIYLQQLCKHFGHKLETSFNDEVGLIKFPYGDCHMASEGELLELLIVTNIADDLERLERVVGSHLERFAFREKHELVWARDQL